MWGLLKLRPHPKNSKYSPSLAFWWLAISDCSFLSNSDISSFSFIETASSSSCFFTSSCKTLLSSSHVIKEQVDKLIKICS